MTGARVTQTAEETVRLGQEFGCGLRSGDVVGLVGTLGAGKTQFVKGICAAFGVRSGVLSPSFVLMHRYEGMGQSGGEIVINHFDFYRIRRAEELDEIGFRDLVGGDAISVIEWADAFPDVIPQTAIFVTFEHGEDGETRSITLPGNQPVTA